MAILTPGWIPPPRVLNGLTHESERKQLGRRPFWPPSRLRLLATLVPVGLTFAARPVFPMLQPV